ncbi:MAG: ribonuclease H [Desulfobacula sp.]|jgi:ribonuclease HI
MSENGMNENDPVHPWKRMSFKGNKVWAETNADGNLKIEKGTVRVKYNLEQDYEYKAKIDNLFPVDQAVPAGTKSSPVTGSPLMRVKDASTAPKTIMENLPDNCITIFTDGASSGNPGPAGIGIVFIYGEKKREISSFIGRATNNTAELTAIKVGLEELKRYDLPVRIFSDSSYAIGLLSKGWKAKANQTLIFEIRSLMTKFSDLAFIKVKGHSGIKENEVADFLATSAIKKGLS